MLYRISTLVDITNTNARRGEDPVAYRQNQNYLSLLNVIGMRTNVEFISLNAVQESTKIFGTAFKGTQTVWQFTFEIDREGYFNIDTAIEDFDYVPFIPELEESVEFNKPLFHTKDLKYINIVFEQL